MSPGDLFRSCIDDICQMAERGKIAAEFAPEDCCWVHITSVLSEGIENLNQLHDMLDSSTGMPFMKIKAF